MMRYYYTDGKDRFGPYSVEELKDKNLSPDTLVWKEGLPDWVPARNLEDLQSLFQGGVEFSTPAEVPYVSPVVEAAPKNWLIESILVTLLCCLPFGIVGIIHASKVDTLWASGQREAAIKASQEAGKWVKIGFFVGIIAITLYFIFIFFGVIAGFGDKLEV